jgi:hypothetical protein
MAEVGTTSTPNQQSQPAGIPTPDASRGGHRGHAVDGAVLEAHARLCELMPDQAARAALLKVPTAVDAAWLEGRMLPVLRGRRTAIEAALRSLEYERDHKQQ